MINIYDLPLKMETIEEFYGIILFCCNSSDLCSQVKHNLNVTQYYYRESKEKQVSSNIKSVILILSLLIYFLNAYLVFRDSQICNT